MDYYFIEPTNVNNLSNKKGRIDFNFVPKDPCNFFESSLTVKLKYYITKKPNVSNIPPSTSVQSFKKFFIFGLFSDASLISNKQRVATQQNIFDYVRSNYLFSNDPRDGLYGMKDIKLTTHIENGSLTFNIPLRFIFSEFKGQNYIEDTTKDLEIKLKENTSHVFTSLNESLDFDYSIKSIILKIPKFLSNNEILQPISNIVWKNESNTNNISHMVAAGKGDIECVNRTERPMNFACFFKDENDNIISGAESVRLMVNSEIIPKMDMEEESDLEHYYELYLRYIDYVYGQTSTEKHEKVMTVLSFEEYKKSPVYYFILPKIKETGFYSLKLKLKFSQLNNRIKSIFYMYNYLDKYGND